MSTGMAVVASRPQSVAPKIAAPCAIEIGREGEVHLPAEAVHALRLLRAEPFLALGLGREAIELLRADFAPEEFAAGARIALQGDLGEFGVSDLFSLLHMGRRTGLLLVSSDGVRKRVYFRQGEIVFANSSAPADRLGPRLLRLGKIDAVALAAAEASFGSGSRFGAHLLALGAIDSATLRWALCDQVEETVYSIFRWTEGMFVFFHGDWAPRDVAEFSIDSNHVLLEGFRRLDEWSRIERRLRSRGVVLRRSEVAVPANLEPRLRTLLRLADGRNSLAEIVRSAGDSEFETCRGLYTLLQAGLVEVADDLVEGAPVAPERSELLELVARSNRANQLVRDVLVAKSVAFDPPRVQRGFLRAATDADRAVFSGVAVGAHGLLPVEPLLENVEQLAALEGESVVVPLGWRRQRLAHALGSWLGFQVLVIRNLLPHAEARELVAYLEAIDASQGASLR